MSRVLIWGGGGGLVNRLFDSMVSRVFIWGILPIVFLFPCHRYSSKVFYYSSFYLDNVKGLIGGGGCLVNRLFSSMVSRAFILGILPIVFLFPCHGYSLKVFYYSSVYLESVKGTHCECLVNRLLSP